MRKSLPRSRSMPLARYQRSSERGLSFRGKNQRPGSQMAASDADKCRSMRGLWSVCRSLPRKGNYPGPQHNWRNVLPSGQIFGVEATSPCTANRHYRVVPVSFLPNSSTITSEARSASFTVTVAANIPSPTSRRSCNTMRLCWWTMLARSAFRRSRIATATASSSNDRGMPSGYTRYSNWRERFLHFNPEAAPARRFAARETRPSTGSADCA